MQKIQHDICVLESIKILMDASYDFESCGGDKSIYIRGLDRLEQATSKLFELLPREIQDRLNEDR